MVIRCGYLRGRRLLDAARKILTGALRRRKARSEELLEL